MAPPDSAALLRIYTDEGARNGMHPLFEVVVKRARDAGLAGATVLRGPMGFGRSSRIHNANIIDLGANLPLVIEIVDDEAKLRAFLATIEGMEGIAIATLEKVEIVIARGP